MVVIVLKPYVYDAVLPELKGKVKEGAIVVTVAAGITISYVKEALGGNVKMVRVMPNTPAMVGEGMSAVTFDEASAFSAEEKKLVGEFFDSFGKYVVIPESLQDAAIPASGSSSAFVYVFIEAMADAAVCCGIPRDTAYKMTAQTVLGAAKMVLETGEHPGKLKDNVCSPGGTTIAGVAALEEAGFRNAIMKAADACYQKAIDLKK
jgi:pyrroline-5-carboxylate reductase